MYHFQPLQLVQIYQPDPEKKTNDELVLYTGYISLDEKVY